MYFGFQIDGECGQQWQATCQESFEEKVENFKTAFDAIHSLTSGSVSDTLKVHMLSCHCHEFVGTHGHTMAHLGWDHRNPAQEV